MLPPQPTTVEEALRQLAKMATEHRLRKINPYPLSFKERTFLAQLTEKFDFNCQFNESGVCHRYKDYHSTPPKGNCCAGCKSFPGIAYLYDGANNLLGDTSDETEQTIQEITPLFDRETGFWRERIGCILPRKYRSGLCLSCCCSPIKLLPIEKAILKLIYSSYIESNNKRLFLTNGKIDLKKIKRNLEKKETLTHRKRMKIKCYPRPVEISKNL